MFGEKNRITIRIEGPEQIRFLNICAYHRICFQKAEKCGEGIVCQVGLSDFCNIFRMRHKARVSVTVLKKQGIYFWVRKNRERKAAYLFGALAFCALYLLSLFIWDISFEGNVRYTDSYLLNFLREEGYSPGMMRNGISCSELEKEIRNEYGDITWVSARIDGTRLIVQIKENREALQDTETEEDVPSCLYASKSGVVSEIVTRSGIPKVKAGEEVAQGDLLVEGMIPIIGDSGEAERYQYTRASADIWIRYETYFEARVSRMQDVRSYQKTQTGYGLQLFGKEFVFPPGKTGNDTERFVEQRQLCLFENFYLPVSFEEVTIRSYKTKRQEKSDAELFAQANKKLLSYLESLEQKKARVLENNVAIEIHEDYCLAKGTLLLEENAVLEQPLETTAPLDEGKEE